MDIRRIATAVGVTAGGALAAAFFFTGVATAATDITVGDGALTVDGLTYTPDGPAAYTETTLSYPPYYQSAIAHQAWDVTDTSGYHIGSLEVPTTITDWYGITTTQFTVDSTADWEAGEIASALHHAGLSDLNFLAGDVEGLAQFLANDADIVLSTVTGSQLAAAMTNFPLQWVDSDDVANLLRPFYLYNADAYATVLGDAGVTDSNFTGGDLQDVAVALSQLNATIVAGGLVTTDQVNYYLNGIGIGLTGVTATDLAHDLNAGTFVDADTIGALLGNAGLTDASFVGGSLSDVVAKLASSFDDIKVAADNITGDQVSQALGTIGFNDDLTHDSIAALLNHLDFSNIPTEGTTYAVTHLMSGLAGDWYNVYELVPGIGSGDPTVIDTLVTPLGDVDMTWLITAVGWDPLLDAGSALGG